MKGIKPIIFCSLLVSLTIAFGNASADNVTIGTGNELIRYCNQQNYDAKNDQWLYCMGYVNGVKGGYASAVALVKLKPAEIPSPAEEALNRLYVALLSLYCSPKNSTREQVALIVSKYLLNHPEKLNESSSNLVLDALMEAWPCAATGK